MEKASLLEAIKNEIKLILPAIDIEAINEDDSLVKIGANSIDRAEIIINTLRKNNLVISVMEFSDCKNIGDIVNIMLKHTSQ